jgi:flavin-dependent dehydrogenase
MKANFVVGADGVHSVVVRSLGLNVETRWPRRIGLVARYEDAGGITDYGEMHTSDKAYCGLAPVGNGLVNVGLVEELDGSRNRGPIELYFDRRVAEFPGVRAALGAAWRITPVRGIGPLAHKVRRVVGPGYLLVGDAAGFRDPFTGEGIYRALRGAELAAEALDLALHQGSNVAIGYEAARREAFADKERVCALVQFFLGKPSLFEYMIDRLTTRSPVAHGLVEVLGDYAPAGGVLKPRYLWSLLRP